MHISLYALTAKRERHLSSLLAMDETPKDNRSKSEGSRNTAVPGMICEKIQEHIDSFPVGENHYANRNTKYLSSELTVKNYAFLNHSKIPRHKSSLWVSLKVF